MNSSYLIDQIYTALISVLQNDGITRKYEARARWLIRRFNIWIPPPVFIIYRRDLPKEILREITTLQKRCPKTLDYVIIRAVEMIFDGLEETKETIFNRNYFLLSVKTAKSLKWRFDNKDDLTNDPDSKYIINHPFYNSNGMELL